MVNENSEQSTKILHTWASQICGLLTFTTEETFGFRTILMFFTHHLGLNITEIKSMLFPNRITRGTIRWKE